MEKRNNKKIWMEYPRRGGTENLGLDYELQAVAYFAVKFAFSPNVLDFSIASNVDLVGDCDDVVIAVRTIDGDEYALFVQIKHKELAKGLEISDFTLDCRKDFNLKRYLRGYQYLCKNLYGYDDKDELKMNKKEYENRKFWLNNSQFFECLRQIDRNKIYLILYTNKSLCKSCKESLIECNNETYFEMINSCVSENVLASCYKFGSVKFNFDEEFLDKIRLFPSQCHSNDFNSTITQTLRDIFNLPDKVLANVTNQFLGFLKQRIRSSVESEFSVKFGKSQTCLGRNEILDYLLKILLNPYRYSFDGKSFEVYYSARNFTWNEIIRHKNVTVLKLKEHDKEAVLSFLHKYIASEVANFVKLSDYPQFWNDPIPHNDLEELSSLSLTLNSKIFEGQLTLEDVYIFLSTNRRIPIVLYVNTIEEYSKVLEIYRHLKFKAIIVGTVGERKDFLNLVDEDFFENLQDLQTEQRQMLLRLSVPFQRRTEVKLLDVLDDSVVSLLSAKDIVGVIDGTFDIGQPCKPISETFINRSLSLIFLKVEVLNSKIEDLFVVQCKDPVKLAVFENYPNVLLLPLGRQYFVDKLKYLDKHKSVHRLIFDGDHFRWNESVGSVTNLRNFCIRDYKRNVYERDVQELCFKEDCVNRTTIISSCPGMGKTTLLDFLAWNAPKTVWCIQLQLKELAEDDTFGDDESLFFNYYKNSTLKNNPLSCAIFDKFVSSNNVIIFLDGFDEVLVSDRHKIKRLVTFLRLKNFPLVISTRDFVTEDIENACEVLALELVPYDENDRRDFLIRYYMQFPKLQKSPHVLKKFVVRLLECVRNNLSDDRFTGVALQTKLLADCFYQQCLQSIEENRVILNERFNLVDLYNRFIEEKMKISCHKNGNIVKDIILQSKTDRYLLALKYLFRDANLYVPNLEDDLKSYFESPISQSMVQKEGIVTVKEQNGRYSVDFVHRTFAEFLMAQWLIEDFHNATYDIKNLVKKLVQNRSNFRFLFAILDQLSSKECPVHTNIINLKCLDLQNIIDENVELVRQKDMFGRTGLHMLALYGSELGEDKVLKIVRRTSSCYDQSLLEALDHFGFNTLDYCMLFELYQTAEIICQKSNTFLVTKIFSGVTSRLIQLKLNSLVKTIFHNRLINDLISNEVKLDDSVEELFKKTFGCENVTDIIHLLPAKISTVSNYLCHYNIKSLGLYLDINLATVYGSKQNVEKLLDQQKQDVSSLVNLAALHGRTKIFDLLLTRGADLHVPDCEGNTALHHLARQGYCLLMKTCLKKQTDFEKKNYHGKTALDLALDAGQTHAVQLLMTHGAKVGKTNRKNLCLAANRGDVELAKILLEVGCGVEENYEEALLLALNKGHASLAQLLLTNFNVKYFNLRKGILQLAAKTGCVDLVKEMVIKGVCINALNEDGETALTCAIKNKKIEVAVYLLNIGSDVYVDNNFWDNVSSAIHAGSNKLTQMLLQKSTEVCDTSKNTPLLMALKHNQIEIAQTLMNQRDANLWTVNSQGYGCLHYSAINGQDNFVDHFLKIGLDPNASTLNGNTPLHLALQNGHFNISQKLMTSTNLFMENLDGNFPLHLAALMGQTDLVKTFEKSYSLITKTNKKGHTPFTLALQENHVETAQFLLQFYDYPNDLIVQDTEDGSVLHLAPKCCGAEDIVQLCVSCNVDVNSTDNLGRTPLHIAVENGNLSTVDILLKAGANVSAEDDNCNTPLHRAGLMGRQDVCKRLLKKGANPNVCNDLDETPLLLAISGGYSSIVKMLVEYNARCDVGYTANGRTLLHYAAEGGLDDWLRKGLELGCDPNDKDFAMKNPLQIALKKKRLSSAMLLIAEAETEVESACFFDFYESISELIDGSEDLQNCLNVTEALLERCSRVNASIEGRSGNTALHEICLKRDSHFDKVLFRKTLELFLKYGAEYYVKNNDGISIYDLIAKEKDTIILDENL